MEKKVICWDLDETIGVFSEFKFMSVGLPYREGAFALRYGIRNVLGSLSSLGIEHYIATATTQEYAEEQIKRSDLSSSFKQIFGRESIISSYNLENIKNYRKIAQTIGLPAGQMSEHMLVIGDSINDQPHYADKVVFIEDRFGMNADASVIEHIITTLLHEGKGHFYQGAEELAKQTIGGREEQLAFSKKRGAVDLGKGIKVELHESCFPYVNQPGSLIIIEIQAPSYGRRKELIKELTS